MSTGGGQSGPRRSAKAARIAELEAKLAEAEKRCGANDLLVEALMNVIVAYRKGELVEGGVAKLPES